MSLIHTIKYNKEEKHIKCTGLLVDGKDLEQYFGGRVNERYYDIEGIEKLISNLANISSTGFKTTELSSFFSTPEEKKSWKIGESFVECYLEDHFKSKFPYHNSRDARIEKASLPGPDLIGFVYIDDKAVFLFGEVKTSYEKTYPPSIVRRSDDGLIAQLKKLKSDGNRRKILITWLGHKIFADSASHLAEDYKNAIMLYYDNKRKDIKMKIIGALVRDVEPNADDLESVYESLRTPIIDGMHIELLGIYLPLSIRNFIQIIGENQYAN